MEKTTTAKLSVSLIVSFIGVCLSKINIFVLFYGRHTQRRWFLKNLCLNFFQSCIVHTHPVLLQLSFSVYVIQLHACKRKNIYRERERKKTLYSSKHFQLLVLKKLSEKKRKYCFLSATFGFPHFRFRHLAGCNVLQGFDVGNNVFWLSKVIKVNWSPGTCKYQCRVSEYSLFFQQC